ncbi:MAG TPA: T9SS type A sorting domain-containing protein [Bacteroidia bacterium]|nr:T9SS type A sorting domain-containing protein [Bacteroidia bacterium]HNP98287.1 T9SS type A sorting domain-containing protein [Bacteroidia bacterium]
MKNKILLLAFFSLQIFVKGQSGNIITNSPVILDEIIGQTYYDLQANGSSGDLLVRNNDGTYSAAWMFSPDTLSNYPNRGTAYNYYDPNAATSSKWYYHPNGVAGAYPSQRTEGSLRTGFPALAVTDSGAEMTIAHASFAFFRMVQNWRPVKGPGIAWDLQTGAFSSSSTEDSWAKVSSSGNTVYAIWNGSGISGLLKNGQNGPIYFSRSDDGGQTWPVVDQIIHEIDSSFYLGFGGSSFSIDASGQTVAIAYGDYKTDIGLLKSTDGGNTWTKTIIKTFPIPFFSMDTSYTYWTGSGVVDTVTASSGDVNVLIDNNGLCHAWWGALRWFRATGTPAGFYSPVYSESDGLMYWNETMGTDSSMKLTSTPDLDHDGNIAVPMPYCRPIYLDGGGSTILPSAGVDENNVLYVSFMSPCEAPFADTTIWGEAHHHVFIMASADGGASWSAPFDVVRNQAQGGNGEFEEAAYPSMARNIRSYEGAALIYQRDSIPGAGVSSNLCFNRKTLNDIVFAKVDLTLGLSTAPGDDKIHTSVYPSPVKDKVNIEFNMSESQTARLEISDVSGRIVYSRKNIPCLAGKNTIEVNRLSWANGIYFYSLYADKGRSVGKLILQ